MMRARGIPTAGAGCALAALLLMVAGAWAEPAAPAHWPRPPTPSGVRLFGIAEQMTINGVPMRLGGFVSTREPAEVIAQFRHSLGQPLVENRLGPQTILGRAEGRHYITVHIQPHGAGARGTVAVSDLQAAEESRHASARERERWLDRLPASTSLVSLSRATDGSKRSLHLVYANRHDEETNARHLRELLRQEGLRPQVGHRTPVGASDRAYFFNGLGKEAVATLTRTSDGTTNAVLSLVTTVAGAAP